MSDIQLTEVIERYLNGEMTADERLRFEMLRKENADVNIRVLEHEQFAGVLKQYAERVELENRLNAIHGEIDVHALVHEVTEHPAWIVRMWRNHHSKISVAASIAIFAILSTLFVTGYFNKGEKYQMLAAEVENVKKSNRELNNRTNRIENSIKNNPGEKNGVNIPGRPVHINPVNPGKFRGTGFAVSANGYIATAYHVITGADSVYVQNAAGDAYKAKVVYTEPGYDVAILKITDTTFAGLTTLPYNIKRSRTDLGEDVYTLGYPANNMVFGPGYLTGVDGPQDDSTKYQVSIPVNPGNSGGPLLDAKGNVIGIISGRQTQVEGASFAIKSAYLFKTIKNIPSDSVKSKISLNASKNTLASLSRTQQIKKLQNYVFMVKVYKN